MRKGVYPTTKLLTTSYGYLFLLSFFSLELIKSLVAFVSVDDGRQSLSSFLRINDISSAAHKPKETECETMKDDSSVTIDVCSLDKFSIEWQIDLKDIGVVDPNWEPPLLLEMFEYKSSTMNFQNVSTNYTNIFTNFSKERMEPDDVYKVSDHLFNDVKPILQVDLLNDPKSFLNIVSEDENGTNYNAVNNVNRHQIINKIREVNINNNLSYSKSEQRSKSDIIESLINHPFTQPKIKRYDLDDISKRLILYFDTETTMPPSFSSIDEILQAIKFVRVQSEDVFEKEETLRGAKYMIDHHPKSKTLSNEENIENRILSLLPRKKCNVRDQPIILLGENHLVEGPKETTWNDSLTTNGITPLSTTDDFDHHNSYSNPLDTHEESENSAKKFVHEEISPQRHTLTPPAQGTSSDLRLEFNNNIRSSDFKQESSQSSGISTLGSISPIETLQANQNEKETISSSNVSSSCLNVNNSMSHETLSNFTKGDLSTWKSSKILSINLESFPEIFDYLFTLALAGELGVRLHQKRQNYYTIPQDSMVTQSNNNLLGSKISGHLNLRFHLAGTYYLRLSYSSSSTVTEEAKYENCNENNVTIKPRNDSLSTVKNDVKISRRRKPVKDLKYLSSPFLRILSCDDDELIIGVPQPSHSKDVLRNSKDLMKTDSKSYKNINHRRYIEPDIVFKGTWPLNNRRGIVIPHASLPGHLYIRQSLSKPKKDNQNVTSSNEGIFSIGESSMKSASAAENREDIEEDSRKGITGVGSKIEQTVDSGRDYTLIPSSSSWSMSMWLYLKEDLGNLGSFRSLFYKGNKGSETRTPSAWFLPDQSGLTIRASTETDMDVGSPIHLPNITKEWAHLVFVFENHTYSREKDHPIKDMSVPMDQYLDKIKPKWNGHTDKPSEKNESFVNSLAKGAEDHIINYSRLLFNERENSDTPSLSVFKNPLYGESHIGDIEKPEPDQSLDKEVQYSISVYVNGNEVVKLNFNIPVISNNGALHIGKDPSYSGPNSFISELKLFEGALSAEDVGFEYKNSKETYSQKHISETISLFRRDCEHIVQDETEKEVNVTLLTHPQSSSTQNAIYFVDETLRNISKYIDMYTSMESSFMNSPNHRNISSVDQISSSPIDILTLKYESALLATKHCKSIHLRYANYRDLARLGHVESMFTLGKLFLWGNEEMTSDYHPNSCFDLDLSQVQYAEDIWDMKTLRSDDILFIDYERALNYFLLAASKGHASSMRIASFLIMNGIGVISSDSLSDLENRKPLDRRYQRGNGARPLTKSDYGNAVIENIAILNPAKILKSFTRDNESRPFNNSLESSISENFIIDTSATSFAIGLLHLAALMGDAESHVSLGYRYRNGLSVPHDEFTASYFYVLAAEVSEKQYFTPGRQPYHEHQHLTKDNLDEIQVGQRGEEDESINFLKMKADEDNIPAMLALGDAYYWGSRGLPRDHPQAIRYFNRASELGNAHAMCLAGGMYLKGEGEDKNATKAIELYTSAAALGSIKALNGLGYAYFYGNDVEQNLTKAFEFFDRAARKEADGDSLFNAGHCLEYGLGVDKNFENAAKYYKLAAERFGHFGSIHTMGKMYLEGQGVMHSHINAVKYLAPAAMAGDWGRVNRAGFDFYLKGNYRRALLLYMFGVELGYDVSSSNAALLFDLKLIESPYRRSCAGFSILNTFLKDFSVEYSSTSNCKEGSLIPKPKTSVSKQSSPYFYSIRYHWIASEVSNYADSYLALGDAFFYGYANIQRSYETALFFYARSSVNGIHQGAFNLAYMYQMGYGATRNYDRAMKQYIHAMVMDKPSWSNWVACQIGIAQLLVHRYLASFELEQSSTHRTEVLNSKLGIVYMLQKIRDLKCSQSFDDFLLMILVCLLIFVVLKIFKRRLIRRVNSDN